MAPMKHDDPLQEGTVVEKGVTDVFPTSSTPGGVS